MNRKSIITLVASLFLAVGCVTAPLESGGSKVVIVDSISASDLLVYDPVGDLTSQGMQSVEDCRNDLRNQAAAQGATIVRITSFEPAFCALDGFTSGAQKKCFNAYGSAFKPKVAKM